MRCKTNWSGAVNLTNLLLNFTKANNISDIYWNSSVDMDETDNDDDVNVEEEEEDKVQREEGQEKKGKKRMKKRKRREG